MYMHLLNVLSLPCGGPLPRFDGFSPCGLASFLVILPAGVIAASLRDNTLRRAQPPP